MNLTFDTTVRIPFPQPKNLRLQSLYFFNMYRAGSSVLEAAAEAFALVTNRTLNNVTMRIYDAKIEFIDPKDYNKSSVFLADEGAPLLKICEIGGYLNYGFREVPIGFARGFSHIGASMLIVRDPRDIGISHYSAVMKHDDKNSVYGDHVRSARDLVGRKSLEEYLLSDELISFLNRISQCYGPMIARGMPVIQYEQLYLDDAFSVELMCRSIFDTFHSYDDGSWNFAAFEANTRLRIANSAGLKGHGTGGTIAMYRSLPPKVLDAYSNRLRDSLDLLGY
ncbi:MAG: hypothetical protein ABI832_03805 [bacterium]